MKKTVLTLLTLAFASAVGFAQSVEDGIKFLYYEKHASAIKTLDKIVKSKNDPYAAYWLGQAYIADKDLVNAKKTYETSLAANPNDPWLIIGSAELELLDNGDVNSAKQKFEQAITATTATKGRNKGKPDPKILNAIARANASGSSKQGDVDYGIEKAKQAISLDPKDVDMYINLGILHLKQGSDHGGEAVEAFREATVIDPKYARAYYRIGLIYMGQNNEESMHKWFGEAVSADPTFAPVYIAYFHFYENTDIKAAKEYLDKYIANADQDCNTEYFAADYLFRAGKYQESLDAVKIMESGACKEYYRIYLLNAYNYNRMGNQGEATANLDKFFSMEQPSRIILADYVFAGNYLRNVSGNETKAIDYLKKAMDMDTSRENKPIYCDTIAAVYKTLGNAQERFNWLKKGYELSPSPTNTVIYNLGDAAMGLGNFTYADSMFTIYKNKYPDQPYGYIARVRNAQAADSTGEKAVAPINEYIAFLSKDTVKNAATLAYYHTQLASFYVNNKKDYVNGLAEFQKAKAMDPQNAAAYDEYIKQLEEAIKATQGSR